MAAEELRVIEVISGDAIHVSKSPEIGPISGDFET